MYPHRPTFSNTVVDVRHTYCRYWPTRHINESVSSTARRRERAGELGSSAAESGGGTSEVAPLPRSATGRQQFSKPQYISPTLFVIKNNVLSITYFVSRGISCNGQNVI